MRLGKNQLALLLIVEQSTRQVGGERAGVTFTWERSIRYRNLAGQSDTFFMMTRDLKSLRSLADRSLVDVRTSGYSELYTITDAGRRLLARLRADATARSR